MPKDSRAGRGPRWDRYEDLLLDAMQVLPLAAESTARGPVYRALYQPAFHADTCVTVYDIGDQAAVEVVVATPGVRAQVMQQIGVRFGPGPPAPQPGGDLQWEHAGVPVEAVRGFRQAVAGLDWAALAAGSVAAGLDGLPVRGDVAAGGALYRFYTWSPSADDQPDASRYCLALLDVALASVHNRRSRLALLAIYPYLRPEAAGTIVP